MVMFSSFESKIGKSFGIFFGTIFAIIGIWGVFYCRWNPIEGSVMSYNGLCRSPILLNLFYLPFTRFAIFIGLLLDRIFGIEKSFFTLLFSFYGPVLLPLFGYFFGGLTGLIFYKIRKHILVGAIFIIFPLLFPRQIYEPFLRNIM